jgi:hypothetical protein
VWLLLEIAVFERLKMTSKQVEVKALLFISL